MPVTPARVFARDLKVAGAGLEPEAIRALLVKTAKAGLAEVIASGEGAPRYTRIVNGTMGGSEESVVLPGPIIYRFSWLEDVAIYALAFLRERWNVQGPSKGGHYRDRHFLMVNGHPARPEDIPADAEIVITNEQPYARKVQIGAKGFLLPKGIYENCRQALYRQFGRDLLNIEVRFIPLQGGYVLRRYPKGRRGKSLASQDMTYPALVISMKA
jgi:hypothetical protein